MESENQKQGKAQSTQKSSLHQVTPLSKYLAMALFILMPFLGGYIGYVYAPEKVVEVEREVVREVVVEKEVEVSSANTSEPSYDPFSLEELETFTDEVVGFTFQYPKIWGPIEIERPSSTRTYVFQGEGMPAGIFLATDFAPYAGQPRPYGPYWGDFVGYITRNNIGDCSELQGTRDPDHCREYTNASGTKFYEYFAESVTYGDPLPHKGDYEYFFATIKPGTTPSDDFHALLFSTDRLIDRSWADNVFRDTVIETFRFIE